MLGIPDKDYQKILNKHKKKREKQRKVFSTTALSVAGVLATGAALSLVGIVLFAITLGAKTVLNNSKQPNSLVSTYTQPTYPIPPELATIIQQTGIDSNTLSRVQVKLDSGVGVCPTENTSACYSDSVIYYPRKNLSIGQKSQNSIFAHEYMHFIWDKVTLDDEKAQLTQSLLNLYGSNPKFKTRLEGNSYDPQSKNFTDELHSFACTEVYDDELGAALKAHCSKYLPNRNALPSYY